MLAETESAMIQNRELTMDDYLAMLRRRLKVILIPTLLAQLAGFLISYAFPPKYTSQSLVLVEEQKVPEGYVAPVVTEDLTQRVATLEEMALGADRLRQQPTHDDVALLLQIAPSRFIQLIEVTAIFLARTRDTDRMACRRRDLEHGHHSAKLRESASI